MLYTEGWTTVVLRLETGVTVKGGDRKGLREGRWAGSTERERERARERESVTGKQGEITDKKKRNEEATGTQARMGVCTVVV